MLFTALASFGAGLLTVLAPCVLPLLPVILGGSVDVRGDRRRPFLIAASLVVSLVLFTLLLKASTVLIGVDPQVWTYLSGGLILLLGISMFFPNLWPRLAGAIGLEHGSQTLLGKAFASKNRTGSAILTGAALGPVFSSCSPTYAWAIATVLPASTVTGMVYLSLYCLGVGVALLAIALAGRKLLDKLGWARDPRGWFTRVIAGLFVLVGLSIVTGLDKGIQTRLVEFDPFGISQLEQRLLPPAGENPVEMTPEKALTTPAAEFVGIQEWVNSEPLTLAGLRGQVVLVDFWTYSCINCQRTQPYLNAWNDKYRDDGLVIVGLHAPEFAFEQLRPNVEQAVREAKITYPVGLDNDFSTWRAYNNRYWPAKYLIDRDGNVRYTHFGEGAYEETENRIRDLLGEASTEPAVTVSADPGSSGPRTPETYLGTARAQGFTGTPTLGSTDGSAYQPASDLIPDQWTLGGRWDVTQESITATEDGTTLTLRYRGRDVYLVMAGPDGATVGVEVDGHDVLGADVGPDGVAQVGAPRLYRLVRAPQALPDATLRLTFSKGVTANAFTFG